MTTPTPMAPAPGPQQLPPAASPPVDPGQAPTQDPTQQQQEPANSPPGGGQSATDAAAGDPMAWQAAAEMDARYEIVQRPMNGTVG